MATYGCSCFRLSLTIRALEHTHSAVWFRFVAPFDVCSCILVRNLIRMQPLNLTSAHGRERYKDDPSIALAVFSKLWWHSQARSFTIIEEAAHTRSWKCRESLEAQNPEPKLTRSTTANQSVTEIREPEPKPKAVCAACWYNMGANGTLTQCKDNDRTVPGYIGQHAGEVL